MAISTAALAGVGAAFAFSLGRDREASSLTPIPATTPIAFGEGDTQNGAKVAANKSGKRKKSVEEKLTPELARAYREAIRRTAGMVADPTAQRLAQRHGLQVLNLTWEDTGRYKGSSVGPNISDMTIQVAERDPRTERLSVTCMPVIRFPNFSDKTCDLDPRDFTLLVGNENGQALKRISLYDFLEEPTAYLSNPRSWGGNKPKTLVAPERDSKVLVSAQACFLPIPKKGKATFNPVIFNYQSYAKNPAVLTILVTREGTSATIIDNQRDAFETGAVWGQRLFHNAEGQRASLTGERESDFRAKGGDGDAPSVGNPRTGGETGMNMVLLIQVPLKFKEQRRMYAPAMESAAAPAAAGAASRSNSNVENAVIGHGELEGPFTEIDNLAIERDPRFPVRVTVQFYKATDNGVVNEKDLASIAAQINRVYSKSDYVGSLVTEGRTGRITEYDGPKVQPPDWWEQFWSNYEADFGISRAEARRRLRELLGAGYVQRPVTELYLRDCLRRK
jgi:hypothetical protein